jgi:hypothetical protein
MEDLAILEKNQGYKEFLDHAHDLRPSKRNASWKDMVSRVASEYMNELITKQLHRAQDFKYVQKISHWPSLKRDEWFQIKREHYSLDYLENCFAKRDKDCGPKMKAFWSNSRSNPDVALRLGKLAKKFGQKNLTWTFWSGAMVGQGSAHRCSYGPLQSRLLVELLELRQKGEIKPWLASHTDEACWGALSKYFRTMLFDENRIKTELSYHVLKMKGLINQSLEDLYLSYYFVQVPFTGDTLNYSWRRLEELKKSHGRRSRVLKNLMRLRPIPGKVFALKDHRKRNLLLSHLQKTFPEYFDGYFGACLDYLDASKQFPRGNPTIECRDFLAQKDAHKWIHQGLNWRYSGLKKY